MRYALHVLLSSAVMALIGCSTSPATTPDSTDPTNTSLLGGVALAGDLQESAVGIYRIEIDPATLEATSSLLETRAAQANSDVYLLSIDQFLSADSFEVERVTRTATTIDLDYVVRHPFPAPQDPTGVPNGFSNRADLSIAGRVLFLADVASSVGNTYFTGQVANTSLITNADAYYAPRGLLVLGTNTNTFPYKVLVDESGTDGARVGISNGGDPTGNYGTDGWTRAEFGATNDGWTGFGFLHGGQAATNRISLDRATLEAGTTFTLDAAILAKYSDPRGGQSAIQKRGNRLPPASPDASQFAYRLPHGALDVAQVTVTAIEGTGFLPNQVSAATFGIHVIDWDARAIETTAAALNEDLDPTTVSVGESGVPSLAVCIPGVLGDATVVDTWDPGTTLLDDDSLYGGDVDVDAGRPGDALFYQKAVTKTVTSGQSNGTFTGMVRATDVETLISGGLTIPLAGNLTPLATDLPEPVTYQAFTVDMIQLNDPPSATLTVTSPTVATGAGVTVSVSGISDPDDATVTLSFDWNDDATVDFTTPAIPVPAGPLNYDSAVNGAITFTFAGPGPDYRTLSASISDGVNVVDITPALGGNNEHFEVVLDLPGWANIFGTNNSSNTRTWDVDVDGAGNTYATGEFSSTTDFGGGGRNTAGNLDSFIVKFDPVGNYVWDVPLGGFGEDSGRAIAVDAAGNSYTTGWFQATVNFGGGNRVAPSTNAIYVVKLDNTGAWQWDNIYGGAGYCQGWGMGIDDAGANIALCGKKFGNIDFGGGTRSGLNQFALVLSAAGVYQWDPVWNVLPGINIFGDVDFDSMGNVFVGGHCEDTSNFGGGPRTTDTDSDDGFVAKFDSSGTWQWDVLLGGPDTEVGTILAVDNADNVYAGGKAFGSADFGSGPTGGPTQYLVKYSNAGVYQWNYTFLSGGANWGLDTDTAGNVYLAGGYTGTVNFGGGGRPNPGGGFDSFVVKLTSGGSHVWDAQYCQGPSVQYTFGLAVAPDNSIRVGGQFAGTQDFEPGPNVTTLSPTGSGYWGFVGRINADGLW